MALDNFRKVNITLNKANQRVLETQIAKVGDANGRELVVQITNNGILEDQTGTTLKLNWQHENGKQGSTSFNVVDIKTGKFSVYYPNEMLYKGKVNASIEITSNGQITNSMNFKIIVQADVFDGEAGNIDGVFISLADVNKKLDDREKEYVELKSRQTSVETQFDTVQQELTGKDVISAPEIIAARNGEDTLKVRLDKDQQEVNAQLAQTTNDLNSRGYNIQWSALEALDGDWTNAFNTALEKYTEVYVPNNSTFNIHGTINLKGGMSLLLGNKSELIKPINADNNEPIVWIYGSNASLKGVGLTSSKITSKRPTPMGTVCLGYKGFTDTTAKNIVYSTIKDIGIFGRTTGGETTGEPSYSLYLSNPEISDLPSYFHTVENLYLGNANVGLMLEGWANANIINNIQFHQVGNEKRLDGAAIKLKKTDGKAPIDNVITNVFHHASLNADTLYLDDGVSYNSIQNINSEQGGTGAGWIRENGKASNNIISGIDNVAGGTSVSSDFFTRNSVIRNRQISSPEFLGRKINLSESATAKELNVGDGNIKESGFTATGLTENTAYGLLKIDTSGFNYGTGTVELEVSVRSAINIAVYKTGRMSFEITTTSTGALVVKKVLGFSNSSIFFEPIINGKTLTFGIKTPNNGTASSGLLVHVGYRLFGPLVANSTPTEIKSNTEVIVSPIMINTHYPQTTMSGTTGQRPINTNTGEIYFDTTLGKPVWWKGSNWVDAMGTTV